MNFARLAADATSLDQAIILYRGELLAGIEPPTPEFEHWLKPERQRLEDLAAKVVEQAAAADLSETAVKRALELGRQLISRDRLREPVYRALMRMLARQRDRAEAMKTYANCRDALMEELGVAPELETEQLYRDILTDRQARTCCPWVNPGRGRRNSGAAIAGSCAVQQYQRRSSIDPAM